MVIIENFVTKDQFFTLSKMTDKNIVCVISNINKYNQYNLHSYGLLHKLGGL